MILVFRDKKQHGDYGTAVYSLCAKGTPLCSDITGVCSLAAVCVSYSGNMKGGTACISISPTPMCSMRWSPIPSVSLGGVLMDRRMALLGQHKLRADQEPSRWVIPETGWNSVGLKHAKYTYFAHSILYCPCMSSCLLSRIIYQNSTLLFYWFNLVVVSRRRRLFLLLLLLLLLCPSLPWKMPTLSDRRGSRRQCRQLTAASTLRMMPTKIGNIFTEAFPIKEGGNSKKYLLRFELDSRLL